MTLPNMVYFVKPIGMDGPIKIGCSNNPAHRLLGLMVWSPWPLEIITTIPGDNALEKNIHECFADCHSHREWFHSTQKLREAVERIRSGTPVGEAIDLTDRKGTIRTFLQKKRRWPLEQREYMGINHRLSHATKRGKKIRGISLWVPQDVSDIMERWEDAWEGAGTRPTEAEFARIWEVLNNPEIHCLTREERYPALAVVKVA